MITKYGPNLYGQIIFIGRNYIMDANCECPVTSEHACIIMHSVFGSVLVNHSTIFLLIILPSLKIAPPPEKSLNNVNEH